MHVRHEPDGTVVFTEGPTVGLLVHDGAFPDESARGFPTWRLYVSTCEDRWGGPELPLCDLTRPEVYEEFTPEVVEWAKERLARVGKAELGA